MFFLRQEFGATQPSAVLDHRVNSQTSAGVISRIELRVYVSPLARFGMFMNYCQTVGHKRVEPGGLISNILEHCSGICPKTQMGVMVFQAQT